MLSFGLGLAAAVMMYAAAQSQQVALAAPQAPTSQPERPALVTIQTNPQASTPTAQFPANEPPHKASQYPDAAWSLPLDPPVALPTFKSGRISLKIDGFDALVFPPAPSRFCLIERSGTGQRVRFMLDLATGKPIGKEVVADEIRGSDVVVSSDGRYLAAETHPSRHIGVWSFATGQPASQLALPAGENFDKFTFVGPHRLVAFHAEDLKTHATIWDVRNGKNHGRLVVDHQWCSGDQLAIAPSPGGKFVAVVCEQRLKIVDPSAKKIVGERAFDSLREREFIRISGVNIDLSHIECGGVAWSPDGTRLALVLRSGLDGFLVCLDARTGGTVSQRVLRTRNLDSDFGELRHVEHNRVDWTWDSGAILLGATRLYDAPTAKELFTLAFSAREGDQPRRILRAWDVLTVARDKDGDYHLGTFPLSKEALTKAIEQVRRAGEAVDSLLPPLTVARFDGAAAVSWQPPAGGTWTSLVDGLAPTAGLPDRIAIAEKDELVEGVFFASPAPGKLVVTSHSAKGNENKAFVQQIDARTGKRAERIEVAAAFKLADVSPDGQFALFRFHEGNERYQRLDVVGLNPKQHIAGWRPHSPESSANAGGAVAVGAVAVGAGRSIVQTTFVDSQHVLSLNESGLLALWKLPECQAVWHAGGVSQFRHFTPSPGRRFLALETAGRMLVVEALTGRVLAALELPSGAVASSLAFRQDGQQLYLSWVLGGQGGYFRRIDAATGRTIDERLFPFAYLGQDMYLVRHTLGGGSFFRSDNIALLNGSALVDLERNVLLWRLALADRERLAASSPDHRLWHWSADPPVQGAVQLLALDPYSDEVRRKTDELKPADQSVLMPGDKIRLVVDLDGAGLASITAQVEAAIRERLASGRLTEDSSAPIVLTVRGFERTETVSFSRTSGLTISAQDLKIGAQLTITDAAGKVVWGHEFVNPPAIDLLNLRGEDLTKDLTRKKRQLVADRLLSADFVRSIPTAIGRDPREILPGESLIGRSGLEPMPAERQLPPKPTGLERTNR